MRSKLILVLALVMGGVTAFLFYSWLQTQEIETVSNEEMVEVVVATQNIQKYQRITSDMLEIKEIPRISLHPDAAIELSTVQGNYALADIRAGEVLLNHRFQDQKEEDLFVTRKINEGYRAVSVGLTFVRSVSNLIEPEDYVDVVYSTELEDEDGEEFVYTDIILEKVRVLAVDRRLIELNSREQYVQYDAVTLELTPRDSVALINGMESGIIQLILHGKEEHVDGELSDQ